MKKLYSTLILLSFVFCVHNTIKAQSEIWGVNANGVNGFGSLYNLQTGGTTIGAQYSFTGTAGSSPQYSKLIEAPGGKLYGMTSAGGLNGLGVIFEYDTATNNFVKKHDFAATTGSTPKGSLMLASNGKLYGMTEFGGLNNFGVIFEYDYLTNTYTKKVDFTGTVGAAIGSRPWGTLIETAPSSGKLLGLTRFGGAGNIGVIFEYDYVNNTYTKKVDFTGTSGAALGANPLGQLVKAPDGNFYGLTSLGGANNQGTLFKYDYTLDVYTKEVDFAAASTGNGALGSLIPVGTSLYGMNVFGGTATPAGGTLFRYDYGTSTFTKLVDLAGGTTNSGANSTTQLLQASNGRLYGVTRFGGTSNAGVIFEYDITGATFTKKIDLASTALVGGQPLGSLMQCSTGKIYGMTSLGGNANVGVLFQYQISSNNYVKKLDFNVLNGGNPNGHLIQASDGKLYGLAVGGGTTGLGVIFEFDRLTQTYTKKIDLNNTRGTSPFGSLLQASNGKLYGLTSAGGTSSFGTLFDYDILTNTYTKRVDFNGAALGAVPYGSLAQFTGTGTANGKLYGMTKQGGVNGFGVIFEFDPTSNVYTKKIDLTAVNGYSAFGSLVQSSNKFYGMTQSGGANGFGVIFEYDPNTNVYTKRVDFTGTAGVAAGSSPFGSLVQTSTVGVLYGMTHSGGANNLGVVFEYNANTNTYTKKFDMAASTGGNPLGSLIRAANDKLYGVTNTGGSNASGVLFEFDIATAAYVKKIDFSNSTGNFPTYTQLLEVCVKPALPGAIGTSASAFCQADAASKIYSINPVPSASSYTWTLPAGASITSSSTIATINVNMSGLTAGTYTYGVAGVNLCGTGSVAVAQITVNAPPNISVNSGSVCSGGPFTITPSGASTYTVQGGSFVVSPTANTTYTVVGTSAAGCVSSNTPVSTVNVATPPVIGVNSGTICAGGTFTIVPSGVVSTTVAGGSLIVSPSSSSAYTLVGADANGCVSANTATCNVTVNALPSISVNSTTMCAGGNATITPSGAGPSGTYTMGVLNGTGPFVVSPLSSNSFTVAGSTSFGCVSSNIATANVTVYARPVISVNNPTMCSGLSATITPSGAGASGTYTVGAQNGSGPFVVSPASSSNFFVTGTSSLGCLSNNTATSAVTVYSLPVVSVNSGTICAGSVYTFNPSGAVSYTMTGPVTGNTFSVSPLVNTSYTFAGISSDGCISAIPATGNVTVYSLPSISVNSGSICLGSSYIINPTGAVAYTLQPGNITSNSNFVVSPSSSSNYSVVGSNVFGCVSSANAISNVSVAPLPVISAGSGAICIADAFTTTVSGASSYTYATPGSTVNASSSVTLSPSSTTTYSVFGTDANGCVSSTPALFTVTVNPLPPVGITGTTAICDGLSAALSATGANTYDWGANTNTVISVSPNSSTTYSVTGTDLNGCFNTATFFLTVHPLPTLSLISGAICPGNTFTLTPGGASTYTFANGSSIVSPSVTTTYTVNGTSAEGCDAAQPAVATVSVVNILTVTVSGNTSICFGNTANLTANGATTYSWSTGAGTNTLDVSPTTNTSYTVVGYSGTCNDTAFVTINVNPLPVLSVVASRSVICLNESSNLVVSGASSYSWSTSSTNAQITVSPTVTTIYSVTGVDANACESTANVSIEVSACVGIAEKSKEASFYSVFPNPNAGEFTLETSEAVNMQVVNALGRVVLTRSIPAGKTDIDLQHEAKGIYFVMLKNAGINKTIKVIKQ